MTDAALPMTSAAPEKPGRRPLVMILLIVLCLAGGFASTFFGLWSPMSLIAADHAQPEPEALPPVTFVALPQIVLTLPGPQMRTLVMALQFETTAGQAPQIQLLLPRLADSFNGFLAGIAPEAFEKRGILEIVRDELATRAVYILGKDAFSDILITEFRIQ